MLLKKLMITLSVIAMVATLGLIQGCSESDKAVEPVVTNISPADDIDQNFEISAFDTTNIMWNSDALKDVVRIPTAATSSWSVINGRIYSRAVRDFLKYVGVQCKPWANRVVRDATGYSLPSTHWNDYYLNYGPHITRIVNGHVIGGGTVERGIGYGNIIQMRIKTSGYTGPHTAIFVAYSGSGMWWIDSNWYMRTHPNRVFMHHVSFDWFRRYVGTEYSVYQAWN